MVIKDNAIQVGVIRKVMLSDLWTTLFFGRKRRTIIEVPRAQFRGFRQPRKGDVFSLKRCIGENGKTVLKMHLNGEEVKSVPLTRKSLENR